MLEGRVEDYKRDLAEKAQPYLGPDEQVLVLALVQEGVRPWIGFIPSGLGAALVFGSIFGDLLPSWMAIVGLGVVLGGVLLTMRIERRMLIRTDERIYAFEIPSSSKAPLEAPVAAYEVADLPAAPAGDGAPRLGGKWIFPNYGASAERGAITEALAPGNAHDRSPDGPR